MTVVALICPDLVAGVGSPDEPSRHSLDEALRALLRGDVAECLVCGEPAELDVSGRAECASCGAVVEASPREVDPDQLAML